MSSTMDSSVDVELLIDCVKSRSVLWNTSDEHYKNRNKKKEEWSAICKILNPDFEEKPDIVKNKISKELQLKWRSIRAAFVRFNRASKKTKSGDSATNTRKYIYARQLEFLLQVPSCNETEDFLAKESLEGSELIRENREEAQDFNDQHSYVSHEPSTSTIYRRKKKSMEEKLETYLEVMSRQSEATMSQQKDDDYNFMLSILPIMKKLSDVEKLKCRCEIMQLLMRYTTQSQFGVQPTPVNIQFASPQTSTQHFEPNMSDFTHEKNLIYNQQHQMIHQHPFSQYQSTVNNRPFQIPPNSQYQTPVSHKTNLLSIATNQPPIQTQTSASYSQSLLQTLSTQFQTTTGTENYEMHTPPYSQVKTTPKYKRQLILQQLQKPRLVQKTFFKKLAHLIKNNQKSHGFRHRQ